MSRSLSKIRLGAWAALLALASSTSTSLVFAQSDEQRAGARSLATEGATAFDEGRYKDALQMFSKAEALLHAPPHLLFLARTHAKLRQYVRAREAYMKVIKEQLPANAPPAFRDAQAAAANEVQTVEPHIGSLVVKVSGAETAKDLALVIDDQPVSALLLGAPQPIDPGTHQLSASAAGFKNAALSVTIKDAERRSVTLTLTPDEKAAAPVAAPPTPPPAIAAAPASAPAPAPEPRASAGSTRTIGLVVGGVGVAALIGGTVTAALGLSKKGSLNDRCPGQTCVFSTPEQRSQFESDKSSLKTLGLATTALWIGGGVLTATGATLFVVGAPGAHEQVSLAPQLSPFGAGLSAQGAF